MGCGNSAEKRSKKLKEGEEKKNLAPPPTIPKCKVLVCFYSMYGHIETMAKKVAEGAAKAGAHVKIMRIPETLPDEVLQKMGAPKKSEEYKDATPSDLAEADCILFGIPTRFGMAAAQVKALMDHTGSLWAKGELHGKMAGIFVSTATQSGGQETTALTFITQFTHHGMIFVPIGYGNKNLMNMEEVRGGSPYGAGCFAGPKGERMPSKLELELAEYQGNYTAGLCAKMKTEQLTVNYEKTVDAAPKDLFAILSDYSDPKYMKVEGIKAEGKNEIGSVRTIPSFGGKNVVEELLELKDMTMTYKMTEFGAFPISSYSNTLTVSDAGEGKTLVKCMASAKYYGPSGTDEKYPWNAKDSMITMLTELYDGWLTNALTMIKSSE